MERTTIDEVMVTKEDIDDLLDPVRGVIALLDALALDAGGHKYDDKAFAVLVSVLSEVLKKGERIGKDVDFIHSVLIALRDKRSME